MNRARAGPGPGAYMLPPTIGYEKHDMSRYRNPQYSIAGKHALPQKLIGPGPHYNVDKLTRNGKISLPAYSIASRPKPLTPFSAPGPGTYSPEKGPRMKEPRPPAYSIASRHPGFKLFQGPGPNQYAVPSAVGPKVPDKHASPAYSILGKHELKSKDKSPGPAAYSEPNPNTYKSRPPQYSIGSGSPGVVTKGQNPGPAAYLPKLPGRCMGGFSFGTRTDNAPMITAEDEMPCMNR